MAKKKEQPGTYSVEMTSHNEVSGQYAKHRLVVQQATDGKDAYEKAKATLAPSQTIVKITITFIGMVLLIPMLAANGIPMEATAGAVLLVGIYKLLRAM